MRIFVTGATGFIGSAVVRISSTPGHEVTGLAPLGRRGAALDIRRARPHRGDCQTSTACEPGRRPATASSTPPSPTFGDNKFPRRVRRRRPPSRRRRRARRLGKPLAVTSGTGLLAQGQVAIETAEPDRGSPAALRARAKT